MKFGCLRGANSREFDLFAFDRTSLGKLESAIANEFCPERRSRNTAGLLLEKTNTYCPKMECCPKGLLLNVNKVI